MKKVFSLLLVLMLALSVAVPGMAAGKTKTKIALDKKGTVTMNLGETLKLTATVTPEAAVKWSSSKKSVATVENGLVTPRKEGKATITAKAGGKSAKVTVKVVDPKKPTGLTITQGKKATLDIDKTLTLGITLQPAGAESALKFRNSNKKVATVDANGVVTPKKEGKTKITVTSAKNKKAKATITVTVKDPYKPTKVTINQGKKQTLTVGDTLQLTTTLSPSTAKADLTFKSSKKSVASVDPKTGVVTAKKKGTAKITVTAKNNKKAKATITITVMKAAPSKDLLTYIGMPIAKAAKQLNFKIADFSTDPKPFFIAGSGPASLWASGKKADTALIDEVEIENSDSKYCIAGVTIGMKWSDAQTLLKSSGWTYEGDWRFTRNGIVLEVSPEELDSESKVYHLIADKR